MGDTKVSKSSKELLEERSQSTPIYRDICKENERQVYPTKERYMSYFEMVLEIL
jgi:hypothetical protein